MRALLIVNPNATSTTPAARDLLAHALESRVELRVEHTTHRGHAAELAQWAATEGVEVIVVHGGDGTVNEAVNGFLPEPGKPIEFAPRIAVLPGGSANVFARSLGIAADPVVATNQLIDLLADGAHRRIGLGYADNRWFTFNAGLGVDARVCEAIDNARAAGHTPTPTRYVANTVLQFMRTQFDKPLLTLRIPGAEPVTGVHYAFVSNSSPWTYLDTRPIHTNPGTTFEGGLGIFAMRTMGVVPSLWVARQLLFAAEPKSDKLFRVDDLTDVQISAAAPIGFQMDGDYLGTREHVEFRSVPETLDVIAPPVPTQG